MKPTPKAPTVNDNILALLLNAYYQADSELQNYIEEKGWQQFTHAQSMIFLNMSEGRDRSVEIAKYMGVSKQAVNRTIKELVELDLIQLIPDESDKRAKKLVVTTKGALITQAATEGVQKLEDNIANSIGSGNFQKLKGFLKKI